MSEWISVEERLPPVGHYYLVFGRWSPNCATAIHKAAWNTAFEWSICDGKNTPISPSHWMPLPEPPREKNPSGWDQEAHEEAATIETLKRCVEELASRCRALEEWAEKATRYMQNPFSSMHNIPEPPRIGLGAKEE